MFFLDKFFLFLPLLFLFLFTHREASYNSGSLINKCLLRLVCAMSDIRFVAFNIFRRSGSAEDLGLFSHPDLDH